MNESHSVFFLSSSTYSAHLWEWLKNEFHSNYNLQRGQRRVENKYLKQCIRLAADSCETLFVFYRFDERNLTSLTHWTAELATESWTFMCRRSSVQHEDKGKDLGELHSEHQRHRGMRCDYFITLHVPSEVIMGRMSSRSILYNEHQE